MKTIDTLNEIRHNAIKETQKTITELRAKALKELESQVNYLKEFKDDIDYHRACATAWAYGQLGLITYDEVTKWVDKFDDTVNEV